MAQRKGNEALTSLELRYQATTSVNATKVPPRIWKKLGAELTIGLSPRKLIVPFRQKATHQFVYDRITRTRLHIDWKNRQSIEGMLRRAPAAGSVRSVRRGGGGEVRTVGGRQVAVSHVRYEIHGLVIDCLGASRPDWSASTELWELLLPFADPAELPDGVPLEIRIETTTLRPVASLGLKEAREIPQDEVAVAVAVDGISAKTLPQSAPQHRAGKPAKAKRWAISEASLSPLRSSIGPCDFMWLQKQAALDGFAGFINTFARAFGTFRKNYRTSAIYVDWWAQLDTYINCDRDNHGNVEERGEDTENFLGAIRALWLAQKVMAGEDLIGLSDASRDAYRRALAVADAAGGSPITVGGVTHDVGLIAQRAEVAGAKADLRRYLVVCGASITGLAHNYYVASAVPIDDSLFSAAQVRALEQAEWDELTRRILVPYSDSAETDFVMTVDVGDEQLALATHISAYEIEPEIRLEHQPLIESLVYYGWDRVRATAAVKQVYASFLFTTRPAVDVTNVVTSILSGGATTGFQTNAGWGYFNADDAKIAIDFLPKQYVSISGPYQPIGFSVAINRDFTTIDTSAAVFGINVGQDVVDAIGLAVVSLADLMNRDLIDRLNAQLQENFSDDLVKWPPMWHARKGPGGIPTGIKIEVASSATRNYGLWMGLILWGYRSITNKAFDVDRFPQMGFAMTNDYLTNWLHSMIGAGDRVPLDRDVSASVDWASFGITLPDPATLNVPGAPQVGGPYRRYRFIETNPLCALPAVPPDQLGFRGRLRRFWGVVDLSANGATDHAGVIRMRYEFSLDCVRISYSAVLRAPGPTPPRDGGDSPSGHRDDPWTPDLPPVCLWDFVPAETGLLTLMKVAVEITTNPHLGFYPGSDVWLPGIQFSIDAAPDITANVLSFTVDPVLGAVNQTNLQDKGKELALADATEVLKPAMGSPAKKRPLIPEPVIFLFQDAPTQLLDAIVFEQASGRTDAFEYHVSANVLHWPIRVREQLTGCIAQPQ